MCKAFSCIVTRDASVTWKLGVDSHEELTKLAAIEDGKTEFARIEIAPTNNNYISPCGWQFVVDETCKPKWFSPTHEAACWRAQKAWLKELRKILIRKKIVFPFEIPEPKRITKNHKDLLRLWISVRDSVGASVRDSVWASVGASVRDSVEASVWDSVWAYIGSFFNPPQWKYVKHDEGVYPFQPAVDLWDQGLVPSFDGKVWRLHSGGDARIRFEILAE